MKFTLISTVEQGHLTLITIGTQEHDQHRQEVTKQLAVMREIFKDYNDYVHSNDIRTSRTTCYFVNLKSFLCLHIINCKTQKYKLN